MSSPRPPAVPVSHQQVAAEVACGESTKKQKEEEQQLWFIYLFIRLSSTACRVQTGEMGCF